MSKTLNELRQHGRNSCITMECVAASLSCKVASHTHILTSELLLYYPILQSVLACVEVFLVTRMHTQRSVFPNAMCQGGIMLRIQSDGP